MITFWSKIFLIANPHLFLNSGSVSDLHGFYFKRILIQPKIFLLILFQSQADCFLRMKFSKVFLTAKSGRHVYLLHYISIFSVLTSPHKKTKPAFVLLFSLQFLFVLRVGIRVQ